MEQREDFPRRFYLTPRCIVWDSDEVYAWLDARKQLEQNVAHELGASGFLYGNRIVIMKETDVQFPSNFRELGHISFEKDRLDSKAMDILKELIGFGIVKVST